MAMTVLEPRPADHVVCPDWCESHDTFTVHGDDLFETHVASVGYVVPIDMYDSVVEVRLAAYRFLIDGTVDRPAAKVELRHEGHDLSLGANDARLLAELLMAAAHVLDRP
jgi:hypothetical protein